jgi:hypothetical protein
VLLTRAPLYRPPCGGFRARLACVRHAASVDSEPGSNSQIELRPRFPGGVGLVRIKVAWPQTRIDFKFLACSTQVVKQRSRLAAGIPWGINPNPEGFVLEPVYRGAACFRRTRQKGARPEPREHAQSLGMELTATRYIRKEPSGDYGGASQAEPCAATPYSFAEANEVNSSATLPYYRSAAEMSTLLRCPQFRPRHAQKIPTVPIEMPCAPGGFQFSPCKSRQIQRRPRSNKNRNRPSEPQLM